MNQSKALRMPFYLLLAFLVFGVLAYFHYQSQDTHSSLTNQDFNLALFKTPREIAPFQLTEYQHAAFTNKSLKGKWTMMFFGFANCPKLCPTTFAELSKMFKLMQEKNVKQLPQVVLISIDPERDTAERIFNYARSFDPNFIGLRGEPDEIAHLAKEVGVFYGKRNYHDPKNYSINHSASIILFNPEGKLAGSFNYPHKANLLAENYMKLTTQI
jgi:protein SCO1/2